jgi:hypothetical protein
LSLDQDPLPSFSYQGPRFWLIFALVSLFGTTSAFLTIAAMQVSLISRDLEAWGLFASMMLYAAGLLSGFIGATTNLLAWTWGGVVLSMVGRRISDRVLRWGLLACYAIPWIVLTILLLQFLQA